MQFHMQIMTSFQTDGSFNGVTLKSKWKTKDRRRLLNGINVAVKYAICLSAKKNSKMIHFGILWRGILAHGWSGPNEPLICLISSPKIASN